MTTGSLALVVGAVASTAVLLLLDLRPQVPMRALVAQRRELWPDTRRRTAPLVATVHEATRRIGSLLRRLARREPDPVSDRRCGVAALLALAGSLAHPVVGVVAAALPSVVRIVRERRDRQRVAAEMLSGLPDLVDLFRVAAGGGLTVHQAVNAVGAVADEPFDGLLRELQRRVSVGERLSDALDVLTTAGDHARPLVSALRSAEQDGTALIGPLQRASDQARELRRRRAEEAARRVPVKLLFPLVLCVLPAFALLAVVPLLASTLQSLPL